MGSCGFDDAPTRDRGLGDANLALFTGDRGLGDATMSNFWGIVALVTQILYICKGSGLEDANLVQVTVDYGFEDAATA